MAATINVNGLSLVHRGSNGIAMATLPDVCLTPSGNGQVPIPYPNISFSKDLQNGTKTVKGDGEMIAIKGSEFNPSIGDEAGVIGGVKSGTQQKESQWLTYSFDVKIEGKNACRLSDKMIMNHGNTVCMGGEMQPPISQTSSVSQNTSPSSQNTHLLCEGCMLPIPQPSIVSRDQWEAREAKKKTAP